MLKSSSSKALPGIFASVGAAGALFTGGCASGVQVTSPLPKYTRIHATDPTSCVVINSRDFNPGWFLLISFNHSNNTQIDQSCVSRQMVTGVASSDDPYFQTIAVEYYDRASEEQKALMDTAFAASDTTINELREKTPRFVGLSEHQGQMILHYRMPGTAEDSPPAILTRPAGSRPDLALPVTQQSVPQP